MKILLPALALVLAVNANAQTKSWFEGQHSGVKEPMAAAIQNPQQWREIWRRHDAADPVPDVDFTKQSVVVVFLGETKTAGVTVTVVVQQDPLDPNRINVFYRRNAVNKGVSAQVHCEPYAIVKVPRAAVIDVERDGGDVGVPERGSPQAKPKRDTKKFHILIKGLENPSFE
ncbi:MAG: hypothetical protein ACHQ2Z_10615 [Elusimicrobiota bacterium]